MFERLSVWADAKARGAAEQMAADEALLSVVHEPMLRVYRWAGPAMTFGYFQRWDEVAPRLESRAAGFDVCRRWTGGGIVEHGADLTYAIVFPAGAVACFSGGVRAWYRAVHTALMEAMAEVGTKGMSLADPEGPATRGGACFEKPSASDVLGVGGKLAGAALRRTKKGMLWQGSVRVDAGLRERVVEAFAARLSPSAHSRGEPDRLGAIADDLLDVKYGRDGWNRSR